MCYPIVRNKWQYQLKLHVSRTNADWMNSSIEIDFQKEKIPLEYKPSQNPNLISCLIYTLYCIYRRKCTKNQKKSDKIQKLKKLWKNGKRWTSKQNKKKTGKNETQLPSILISLAHKCRSVFEIFLQCHKSFGLMLTLANIPPNWTDSIPISFFLWP